MTGEASSHGVGGHTPGWRGVRSRKFGGDAVLHEGGWYHCLCYPCPNLTKWTSIVWNSHVCPSCMVKKQRAAIAKSARATTGGAG